VPDVFAEPAFKKWWDAAKKALKADPLVGVPQKKTEHFILRSEGLSQSDEVLTAFSTARTLKDQILALDNLLKAIGSFADPVATATGGDGHRRDPAKKNVRLHTAETIQLLRRSR
jgi:hypothetical protein